MIPCPGCARFVRTDAHRCPFCDAVVRNASGHGTAVAGALLGLAVTACAGHSGGETTNEAIGSAYAGPESFFSSDDGPPDTSTSTGPQTDTSADSTGASSSTDASNGSTGVDSTGTEAATETDTDAGTGTGSDTGSDTGATTTAG